MVRKKGSYSLLLLILIYFAYFFLFFWHIPLYPPDEPKYTFAATKMLQTGDYITPYFNCEERLEKPILTYWLIALSYKIFGISDWSSRLPFVILSFFLLLTLYTITRKEFNDRIAIFASLFFCTNIQIFAYSKAIIPETPLLLFNTLSTIFFYYGIRKENKSYIIFAYIFAGLGFLTKGPLALIIPLGISFPYFFVKRGFSKTLKILLNPYGLLLFLIISLSWYGPVTYIHGMKFINEFFILHNIKRFSGNASMHLYPFYYYVPVIILSLYFWLPLLKNFLSYFLSPKDTDLEKFLFWWVLFVFIFFSLSKNKLHHYIIIIYPALSILMAISYDKLKEKKGFSNIILIIMTLLELGILIFGNKLTENISYPIKPILMLSIFFSVLIIISNNLFKNMATIFLNALKFFLITTIFLLLVNDLKKEINKGLEFARKEIVIGKKMYTYKRSAEDINHYLNICTKKIDTTMELHEIITEKKPFVLVVRGKNMEELKGYNFKVLYKIPSFKARDRYLIEFTP